MPSPAAAGERAADRVPVSRAWHPPPHAGAPWRSAPRRGLGAAPRPRPGSQPLRRCRPHQRGAGQAVGGRGRPASLRAGGHLARRGPLYCSRCGKPAPLHPPVRRFGGGPAEMPGSSPRSGRALRGSQASPAAAGLRERRFCSSAVTADPPGGCAGSVGGPSAPSPASHSSRRCPVLAPRRVGGGCRVPSPLGDAAAVGEPCRPRRGDAAGMSLRERTRNERVAGKGAVFWPAGH